MLHKLIMKQRAIDRSLLHLSNNSYSFVYDDAMTTTLPATTTTSTTPFEATSTQSTLKASQRSSDKNHDFISWSPTTDRSTTTPAAATTSTSTTTTTTTTAMIENKNQHHPSKNDGLPFIGPGLKDQYETLLKLLRDGLLGTYNDDDHNDGDNEEQDYNNDTNATLIDMKPKNISNVSAVLMGPRGHGKSFVLERCLAELSRMAGKRKERLWRKIQQREQKKQQNDDDKDDDDSKNNQFTNDEEVLHYAAQASSFRVVRINGLLYQGDNAATCAREIARQINYMSRTEKKKRRTTTATATTAKQRSSKKKRTNDGMTMKTSPVKSSSKRQKRSADEFITSTNNYNVSPVTLSPNKRSSTTKPSPKSPSNDDNDESHRFRLRQSGFNTNISLLDEALRTARIDGVPILIVLEELDTFLAGGKSYNMMSGNNTTTEHYQEQRGSNDRQLLLYHLLDRVADHKFLVSLVGVTTNLSTINQLEKRVQSRAEGTSKVIYFGHDVNGGYDACVDTLLGKFYTPPVLLIKGDGLSSDEGNEECTTEPMEMINLRNEVEAIFRGNHQIGCNDEEADCDGEINDFSLVQRALKRNHEMHMDVRWFCGLLDIALSLLMSDIEEQKLLCCYSPKSSNNTSHSSSSSVSSREMMTTEKNVQVPTLSPNHIAHALVMMGASLDDIASTVGRPGIPSQNALEQIRWGKLLGDPNHYSALVGTDPRLVALLDLSGPQIAVLLAARRIMARDDARSTVDDAAGNGLNQNLPKNATVLSLVAPLTYKRIEDEYTTSFVNSERYTISSDRYPPHVLYRSFMDLMELDLIRLKKERCEGGALQYDHLGCLSFGANITNVPLYVNLEWELEFVGVLKAGLLKCSTSLREWGLKIMN
jgi:hypothetical protein